MSEQSQWSECGNTLLSRLPVHERNAAERCFETGSFVAGDLLMHANRPSEYVFFPLDSVISLVRTLDDGSTIELGLVGNEGMIGIDVFLEGRTQRSDAIVQSAGSVYRMTSDDLLRQFKSGREFQRQLLRFTSAFMAQIAQTAACNRLHAIEPRLARWLLMMRDRVASNDIDLTDRCLSDVLGARPALASQAVQNLESAGLIRQSRSRHRITISDREGLELSACECYEAVRHEYAWTLPQ
jgi:CRP-like cAMP-binding protein